MLRVVFIACIALTACSRTSPTPSTSRTSSTTAQNNDPHRDPDTLVRAWIAAVRADDPVTVMSLYHPRIRDMAGAAGANEWSRFREQTHATAEQVARALNEQHPSFARAPRNRNRLEEIPGDEQQWFQYICREQGDRYCNVDVMRWGERWFLLDVD